MHPEYDGLARELRRKRVELLKNVDDTKEDLQIMGEERESEWTESAVEERQRYLLVNLDEHERESLREIDAALLRIGEGTYGFCQQCNMPVSFERLQIVPTARFCTTCAERGINTDLVPDKSAGKDMPESGVVPTDFVLLSDEEIEDAIWEQIHEDGRIETEELSLTCRRGIVFLEGALPSRVQHSILLQIITDVLGFQEVIDRIAFEPLAWQREDRDKESPDREAANDLGKKGELAQELYGSEDIIESEGEVLTAPTPLGQPAPEEQ